MPLPAMPKRAAPPRKKAPVSKRSADSASTVAPPVVTETSGEVALGEKETLQTTSTTEASSVEAPAHRDSGESQKPTVANPSETSEAQILPDDKQVTSPPADLATVSEEAARPIQGDQEPEVAPRRNSQGVGAHDDIQEPERKRTVEEENHADDPAEREVMGGEVSS